MFYEYNCENHGDFEVQQKISDPPLQICPKCAEAGIVSSPPKRLISLSSFSLKGGGWSDTGYSG